jgi:LCP family protein required for cell wall assembly
MSDVVPEGAPPESSVPKRRAKVRRRHTIGKVVLATVLVLAMATGLGTIWLYRHLNDNLNVYDAAEQMTDRPDKVAVQGPQEPLNVLVMGSDSRDCAGCNIDNLTGGGARSDTTILFHLSADRKRAYGISIPRDSIVDRPDCKDEHGTTIPGGDGVMWNEAFAVGGPACTMQQVEQLTGVRLDHFVVVNFEGFQGMVDAIGGVEVCIPDPIVDPAHGINIEAGTRKIEGKEALN